MTSPEVTGTVHPFDAAVRLERAGDNAWRGATEPAYANMVGPFGGTTAATLLRAVELSTDPSVEPLSFTVNFLAPIADGGFEIVTRCVRANRTNQHWLVELVQDGDVKTNATAVFGIRRDVWSDAEIVMPAVPEPHTVDEPVGERFVAWITNYEMRFVEGAFPTEDDGPSGSSVSTLWVRDTPSRAMDFASLTALCDVFFPRVFLRVGAFGPAGTISMTVYFHASGTDLVAQADNFVLATARAGAFSRGYFDQSAQIFGAAGDLLATSHQIVYYKA